MNEQDLGVSTAADQVDYVSEDRDREQADREALARLGGWAGTRDNPDCCAPITGDLPQ